MCQLACYAFTPVHFACPVWYKKYDLANPCGSSISPAPTCTVLFEPTSQIREPKPGQVVLQGLREEIVKSANEVRGPYRTAGSSSKKKGLSKGQLLAMHTPSAVHRTPDRHWHCAAAAPGCMVQSRDLDPSFMASTVFVSAR